MSVIIITDLQHVSIDGVLAGSILSAACNNTPIVHEIEDALAGWVAAQIAAGRADLQTLLEASQAETLAANDAGAEKLREAKAQYDASIQQLTAQDAQRQLDFETFKADAQKQIDTINTAADQFRATSQAAVDQANQQAQQAQKMQSLHWNLSQTLMDGQSSPAAVAALQEIRRLELAAHQAAITAQLAALPQSVA